MIVYDLSCDIGHRFEGWFSSSGDFAAQQAGGLLECPACGSKTVTKAPMAPAVGRKGNTDAKAAPARTDEVAQASSAMAGGALPAPVLKAMEALAKVQAKALKSSEYVGDRFAEESRAMHYGERDQAIIHGKASAKDAAELLEEGIAVAPLLVPFTPPEDLN
jgi:hypothetical protein